MSRSRSKSTQTQSGSSRPTFNTVKGLEPFVQGLLNRQSQSMQSNFDQDYWGQGMDFFSNMAAGRPMDFTLSQPLLDQIFSREQAADLSLPSELAQTRNQFYRQGAGANLMGLDNSLMRNRVTRDLGTNDLIAQQFNLDTSNRANAAANLLQSDASRLAQAMQLIDLLAGEESKGTTTTRSRSSGFGLGSILGGAGGLLSGLGDFRASG